MSEDTTTSIPDVIVDSREPESLYLSIAKACEGKIVVREAASTDIIIPGTPSFAIERKEVGDFIGTWQANRLYEQLATLKNFQDAGYKVTLLLSGNVTKELRYRKMKYNQLLSMVASVWARWDIPVFFVDQEWAVPYFVKYLAGVATGEKHDYKIAKAAPRDATPEEQALYVLQSFPGVGVKLSDKVREKTHNLLQFTDRAMDGGDVGLTPKQAEKIIDVLIAPWKDEPKEESK